MAKLGDLRLPFQRLSKMPVKMELRLTFLRLVERSIHDESDQQETFFLDTAEGSDPKRSSILGEVVYPNAFDFQSDIPRPGESRAVQSAFLKLMLLMLLRNAGSVVNAAFSSAEKNWESFRWCN